MPHPDPQRIALIKPSALGDIMHSLPVLPALRQRFPHAHITWVVNRLYEPLLKGHPDLDATLAFDRGRKGMSGMVGFASFLKKLRGQAFDLAIDLQGLLRSAIMTFATGAPPRIGLSSAREGATWFYNEVVADDRRKFHAVERYWRVVEALGAQGSGKIFRLPVADDACAWAGQLLRGRPRPWLGVGVGARWLTKRWPPEHFAQLARLAQQEFGGTLVFIGAPDEAALSRQAASLVTGPVVDVAGQTTLPQLAALLSQVDVLLANDTGPLHLAVALGRLVVAPYTCTKVSLTGPYGHEHRAVESNIWCQGSYLRKCPRLECMAELTPDRLWPPLREILQTWARRSA